MAIPPGPVTPVARNAPPGLLDAILDASREAIVVLDAGGNVTVWSRGAELAYGYRPQEAVGRPLSEFLVPAGARPQEEEVRLALLAGGQAQPFESVRRRKDGSEGAVLVTMQALRDPHGKVAGFCLVEREAGEGRLAEEVTRLQERDRLRTDFLSESAHELNTPLTPIRLQLQLLQLMKNLTAQEKANIDAIERNILRLGGLVQDMLDASRLQAGRFRLERSRFDLGAVVADAAEAFREQAHREGITLAAHPAPTLMVDADSNRVTQVLFNLLSNALKFNRRGGTVEVGAKRDGKEALVWVRDTGLGMDADQLERLFRPFGRLHEHLPGIPKGTGLGLYISKGIVERHGGRLWAESPGPGKGSTWRFTLPLEQGDVPGEGPQTTF